MLDRRGKPWFQHGRDPITLAVESGQPRRIVLRDKNRCVGVYDSDPRVNPAATRYTRLTYDEALAARVRVMDTSAFVLASEQALTMHIFDVAAVGVMRRICEGADSGTRISAEK